MGQHTWFYKDKELYKKQQELFKKYEKAEQEHDYLECGILDKQIDDISEENDADYHDVFRTSKRQEDKTYIEEVIWSRKECYEWLEQNKEHVYDLNKELLSKFWNEHPNGCIDFG